MWNSDMFRVGRCLRGKQSSRPLAVGAVPQLAVWMLCPPPLHACCPEAPVARSGPATTHGHKPCGTTRVVSIRSSSDKAAGTTAAFPSINGLGAQSVASAAPLRGIASRTQHRRAGATYRSCTANPEDNAAALTQSERANFGHNAHALSTELRVLADPRIRYSSSSTTTTTAGSNP